MTRTLLLTLTLTGLLTACSREEWKASGEPPFQPAKDPAYSQSIGFTGLNVEPY